MGSLEELTKYETQSEIKKDLINKGIEQKFIEIKKDYQNIKSEYNNEEALEILNQVYSIQKEFSKELEKYKSVNSKITDIKNDLETKLIENNRGLIFKYLENKQFIYEAAKRKGIYKEEIILSGEEGIGRAIKNYDPSKSKFSTWATECIKNTIREITKFEEKHTYSYNKMNDEDEILSFMEIGDRFQEKIDNQIDNGYFKEKINKVLSTLTFRERTIIEYKFGLNGKDPLILKEIGTLLCISRERVRQIKEVTLKKLKSKF